MLNENEIEGLDSTIANVSSEGFVVNQEAFDRTGRCRARRINYVLVQRKILFEDVFSKIFPLK